MTYNEKKSLYESIMKDVAKIVKRLINENDDLKTRVRRDRLSTAKNWLEFIKSKVELYDLFLEKKFPVFKGTTKEINGFID